jgi:cytochrome c-type biogenesis protein CcmH
MTTDLQAHSAAKSLIGAQFRQKLARKPLQCLSFALAAWLVSTAAMAQLPTPAMPPASPESEARLKKLETELRCLVCQNQTLADSPAGLAGDLRREIRLLADQGKSNEEIKAHLRARYGDFVLYKPEVEPKTWLLWGGPFVLLMGGAGVFFFMNRRRTVAAPPANPAAPSESDRARKLLDGD